MTGKALLKQGRDPEAIAYFRQAVQIDPNNPRVLTYLAQVLASDENPQVRDANHALAMAAKANDLTGGVQPAMLDAMAMAYADLGQFTNAQQAAAYALKLATAYAFVGVLGAEFILSNSGLGYQIGLAFNNFDNPTMYGLILFVVIVVGGVNTALFAWERNTMRRQGR